MSAIRINSLGLQQAIGKEVRMVGRIKKIDEKQVVMMSSDNADIYIITSDPANFSNGKATQ